MRWDSSVKALIYQVGVLIRSNASRGFAESLGTLVWKAWLSNQVNVVRYLILAIRSTPVLIAVECRLPIFSRPPGFGPLTPGMTSSPFLILLIARR